MSFWVYVLRCSDASYYTGHTDDLERRIAEHHSGELPGYTHDRRPVTLLFAEVFPTREDALAAERRIKPWSRAKKEALIARDWERLSIAAMPPSERAARAPRLRSGRTAVEGPPALSPPFAPSEVEGPPQPGSEA